MALTTLNNAFIYPSIHVLSLYSQETGQVVSSLLPTWAPQLRKDKGLETSLIPYFFLLTYAEKLFFFTHLKEK